jgi:hypothetical protein
MSTAIKRGGWPRSQRRRVTRVTADEDQPAADESDPSHDLRGHPGRVQDHVGSEHVGEPVLADEHEQRRPGPDQRVSAQPG